MSKLELVLYAKNKNLTNPSNNDDVYVKPLILATLGESLTGSLVMSIDLMAFPYEILTVPTSLGSSS